MSGRKRKLSERELNELVRQLCTQSWVRQVMDELETGAGRVVTRFLLYAEASGHALSPRMMCKIAAPAQSVIDVRVTGFGVWARAVEGLKEGEVTLLVLASVGPEPQAVA